MHVFNKVHEDSEDLSLGILKPPTNGCQEGWVSQVCSGTVHQRVAIQEDAVRHLLRADHDPSTLLTTIHLFSGLDFSKSWLVVGG